MNDPTSAISAAPPRYLLESDSSDEEGQGYYAGAGPSGSKPKIRTGSLTVDIEWVGTKREYESAVVSIGQVGRYLTRKTGAGTPAFRFDGGQGLELAGTLVVLLEEEGNHERVWAIAKALFSQIKIQRWVILSEYLPAMYIPKKSLIGTPIRYLHLTGSLLSDTDNLSEYESPNTMIGLPAALASLITHPATPSAEGVVLAMPLPLSYVSISSLTASLEKLIPKLAQRIGSRASEAGARWGEEDDEPYSGIGMGGKRTAKERALRSEDIGNMYM